MAEINPLDPLHRTRVVATSEGITARTLYARIRAGRFPPPDVKHDRHGAPDFWYESTLRRVREARARAPAAA
jgi:hypothetical protein